MAESLSAPLPESERRPGKGPVFYDPRGHRRRWTVVVGLLVTLFSIVVLLCVGLVLDSRSTGYEYQPIHPTTVGAVP